MKKLNNSNIKLISILTLILIATLFLVQNTQVVNIDFLFWTYSASVSVTIVVILLIGILVGWFSKGYINHKKKKSVEKQKEIT